MSTAVCKMSVQETDVATDGSVGVSRSTYGSPYSTYTRYDNGRIHVSRRSTYIEAHVTLRVGDGELQIGDW